MKGKCILITNLDKNQYSDDEIVNIYRSRWDIEVFFKLIKNLLICCKIDIGNYFSQIHIQSLK